MNESCKDPRIESFAVVDVYLSSGQRGLAVVQRAVFQRRPLRFFDESALPIVGQVHGVSAAQRHVVEHR